MSDPVRQYGVYDEVEIPSPSERSDEELVADLLGLRLPVESERVALVLRACRGLAGLPRADAADMVCEGVDADDAVLLLAALEIGRRLAEAEVPRVRPLEQLPAVAAYLALRYQRRTQEVLGALLLDRRERLVHHGVFYRGTLSRAAVEPRAVLVEALYQEATAVALFHTHPSGDPSLSFEDIAFTLRMYRAGAELGVELLDHLIIGGVRRWVSLRERAALMD